MEELSFDETGVVMLDCITTIDVKFTNRWFGFANVVQQDVAIHLVDCVIGDDVDCDVDSLKQFIVNDIVVFDVPMMMNVGDDPVDDIINIFDDEHIGAIIGSTVVMFMMMWVILM